MKSTCPDFSRSIDYNPNQGDHGKDKLTTFGNYPNPEFVACQDGADDQSEPINLHKNVH